MGRVGEKMVFGTRVLVRAKSQRFGGSLWREDGFREPCVSLSEVHSVLVAPFGEKMVSGRCVLVGAKS